MPIIQRFISGWAQAKCRGRSCAERKNLRHFNDIVNIPGHLPPWPASHQPCTNHSQYVSVCFLQTFRAPAYKGRPLKNVQFCSRSRQFCRTAELDPPKADPHGRGALMPRVKGEDIALRFTSCNRRNTLSISSPPQADEPNAEIGQKRVFFKGLKEERACKQPKSFANPFFG